MLDRTKLMVMSEKTWKKIQEKIADNALDSPHPIEYIDSFKDIDLEIDNDLPFNFVEVYERWQYEQIKENGRS